jgi:predicted Rossmann fold nucleotide-binding protein DprA/Smf involved in DNA uptake
MNPRERGFLLLSSHLGDSNRHPLTTTQMRTLAGAMKTSRFPEENREMRESDLVSLGFGRDQARRIVNLLDEEAVLDYYLQKANMYSCVPVTRVSEGYPLILRKRLGLDSPGVLWAKGDMHLLETPTVALVGSRIIGGQNLKFAEEVGRQAALQGYTLVSGNARGADRTAQEACLNAGGNTIIVVPDALKDHKVKEHVLYLSEDGFDEPFSTQRALSRNRVIHSLGLKTFVAQVSLKTGGTWDGTVKNLRFGWSPVFCYDDGAEATDLLCRMGANPIDMPALASIYDLEEMTLNMFDR